MTHLLCFLGIHRPTWQAMITGEPAWLQVRQCAACGQLLGKPRFLR